MNLKCVSIRNNQWYIQIANIIAVNFKWVEVTLTYTLLRYAEHEIRVHTCEVAEVTMIQNLRLCPVPNMHFPRSKLSIFAEIKIYIFSLFTICIFAPFKNHHFRPNQYYILVSVAISSNTFLCIVHVSTSRNKNCILLIINNR